MNEPTPAPEPTKQKKWVTKELNAAWEFAKRDWEQTKHDIEDVKATVAEARQKQETDEEMHPPKPGALADYKPSRGHAGEEQHGWSLGDPHHSGTTGHRETGR